MKFKPEEPFAMFDVGYEYFNDFVGRYQVALSRTGSNKNPVTMFRSRYRFCVFLGYILPSYIHVDHKDENKLNDDIDNLQELKATDNVKKHFNVRRNGQPMEETYTCSECGKEFREDHGIANSRKKMSKSGDLYCTMACSIKARAKINTLSEEEQNRIKELRRVGKTIKQVTELTGYGANTIMKYQDPDANSRHYTVNTRREEMIKDFSEGMSLNKMAKKYRLSKDTIRPIVKT